MKPREAFTDSVGDITPPVLAAGGPGFPQALIGTLRRLANVGHCLVFSPVADGAVRRRLDIGNIAIGGARGLAYSERFHGRCQSRRDPEPGRQRSTDRAADLCAAEVQQQLQKAVFRRFRQRRQFASAIWVDGACFYVKTATRRHSPPRAEKREGRP